MKAEDKLIRLAFCSLILAGRLGAQEPDSALAALSLDELLNIKISAAAKYEQTISEAPASVTIVTADEIKACGFATLEDVFKSVRGFYISNDRNYSYLGARGFSRPTDYNNRILLLINGHTLNENFYGAALLGTELGLDLAMLERIEIVRGPGSALYGSSALFAVVNLVTKKGQAIDGLTVAATAGSYGKSRLAAQFGKEFANGADILVSALGANVKGQDLYFPEYDDPATNNGVAENLDWDKYYSLFAALRYKNLLLQGDFTARRKGIPTGAYEVVFNDQAAKTYDARRMLEIKFDQPIGADKNFMARVYFDHYGYAGGYPYELDYRDASDGDWVGGDLQFRYDPRPNNRLTAGVEYQKHLRAQYFAADKETQYADGNFPFAVFSFYLQDEYQIHKNLALTLGMRWDEYSTAGSARAPRAAVVYHPFKASTLKLLYGEAFRAPSAWEVNSEDGVSYKSNLALKPERITTSEAVWEQRLAAAWFGTVAVYEYKMKDLIDPVLDRADSLIQFRNISRVKASGLEFELNFRPQTGSRGYASYALQRARDPKKKKILTNSPRHLGKIGLIYPLVKFLNATLEVQYETERLTVYRSKTNSYVLTNVRLSTASATKDRRLMAHLQMALAVNNLFDVSYQTPGGLEHRQAAITQNGRNYQITAQYKF
jgi:iron complex outermembrane receptor protein